MEADAVSVVESMIAPGSLHGVRIYFPDPWPKPRHHKRRLVQSPFVQLLLPRLEPGGFIHCATDDLGYGQQMLDVFSEERALVNAFDGFAPRPPERPITKYERRAVRHGRSVVDVYVTRRLDP
jgi:tRNA (guanine-N7-)-methyltransferase